VRIWRPILATRPSCLSPLFSCLLIPCMG
jgi:hypothetical protein